MPLRDKEKKIATIRMSRLNRSRSHDAGERSLAILPMSTTARVPSVQAGARPLMCQSQSPSIMDISVQSHGSPANVRPVPLHFADIEQLDAEEGRIRNRSLPRSVRSPRQEQRQQQLATEVVARAFQSQMQVALDVEHFDRSATGSMPSAIAVARSRSPPQAAPDLAPVVTAMADANKRAEAAEASAKQVVHRVREVAVHAVAASQIEANERVQEANEAARSAVIQAESTTVAAQAQVQIAAAETQHVKAQ